MDPGQSDVNRGFRIFKNNVPTWVPTLLPNRTEGPETQLVEFYVKAHSLIQASGVPNFIGVKLPVPTKLHIPEWETRLGEYEDRAMVDLLCYGFPIGYNATELPVSEVKNHRGALEFSDFVDDYLDKQISRELMLGPLSYNPLGLPLSVSPLNTVPKKGKNQRRVICDLSYPRGTSINDGISKDFYLDTAIELTYPTVDTLATLLKQFGVGAHIFKKDLKAAYRQFHIDPGDVHLTGYCWNSQFYIDIALVMGSRSAAIYARGLLLRSVSWLVT